MAREIQRAGACPLGRPHLRPRIQSLPRLAAAAHLPWRLGRRALPVAVRARVEPAWLLAADARVAPADGDPRGARRHQSGVPPVRAGGAAIPRPARAAHRPRLRRRVSRTFPPAIAPLRVPAPPAPDRRLAPRSAP